MNTNDLEHFDVVAECPHRQQGKWMVPVVTTHWIPKQYLHHAHLDPAGNVSGSNDGDRYCLETDIGPVELREGDRVVVLRPKPPNE
jgi:hypothetical protein